MHIICLFTKFIYLSIHELHQVLCDILRSGGLPGQANGQQPPLYFAADDLEYQVG